MNEHDSTIETSVSDSSKSIASWSCATCGLLIPFTTSTCPQDGTPHDAQEQLSDLLSSNYEFVGTIGTGGMSVIYKARQLMLNKVVAIKMLHSHLLNENSIMRFQHEAKAVSSLKHPNVIAVHDFGISKLGQPYMVMDFIDGKTLAQLLHERGALPLPEAMDIFLAVTSALEHAHQNNLLHRDLKPSNIMLRLTDDGYDVFLVDFGIAKIIDSEKGAVAQQLTQTGEIMGSPLYMSPEQCMGKKLDQRSDIYSLGCILYEAVVGVPPHSGNTMIETIFKHLNELAEPLHTVRPDISFPEAFEDLVMRMLATSADNRIQTISEVQERLLSIQSGALKRSRPIDAETPAKLKVSKLLGAGTVSAILSVVALTVLAYSTINLHTAQDLKTAADKQLAESARISKISQSMPTATATPAVSTTPRSTLTGDLSYDTLSQLGPAQTAVDLESSAVSDGALLGLTHLPNLTSLNLAKTSISDSAITAIAKLKSLTNLSLKSTKISSSALAGLGSLQNLRELDLDNTDTADDALLAISKLPNLTTLNLRDTAITDKGLDYLQKNARKLTSLSLSGTSTSNRGLVSIAKLNLTELYLWDTKVSANGIKALRTCQSLSRLYLSRTRLSEEDLAALGSLKNLREIELYHIRNLKDDDLKYFIHSKSIVAFYVEDCPLTDGAAAYLAQMPQLTGLCLNETKITNQTLARISNLQNLTALWLQMTHVSDAGMKFITRMKRLEKLYITGTSVSDAGIKELDALPALKYLDAQYCPNVSRKGIATFFKSHVGSQFVVHYVE